MIDLRSDTVTQPTAEMRQVIAQAPVGDDVLGDDPTINILEQRVAELLGKEAAVYMPSGSMTNQVAIRAHTEPGDEIICEATAHVYRYEAGAPAALSGVSCRLIDGSRGLYTAEQLRAVFHPNNYHFPRTRLVCVENTSNRGGGAIWPLEQIKAVEATARDAGLKLHLDGARLWNAAVATGMSEKQYASHFDSVSVCFSKGLGAPVGSALAGTAQFVDRARRFRKIFGGAMRQAGIIAAGALYALDHHRRRLAEDHANAQKLAQALVQLPGVILNPADVQTNIVIFDLENIPAAQLVAQLAQAGVGVLAVGPNTVRAVTSLAVTTEQIDQAGAIFKEILTEQLIARH